MVTCDDWPFARIAEGFEHIIDSDGNAVAFDDPRVVHVYPYEWNSYQHSTTARVYEKHRCRVRESGAITSEVFREMKDVCSGRECLSFHILMAGIRHDMKHNRAQDEITVYNTLEDGGPCGVGGWAVALQSMICRKRWRNVIFPGNPSLFNNFIGLGESFGTDLMIALIVGDYLYEAERALRVIGVDGSLETFRNISRPAIQSIRDGGMLAVEKALRKWAREAARIPRRCSVHDVPKILVFGGGGTAMYSQGILDTITEQGIIVKPLDMYAFILHIEGQIAMRYCLRRAKRPRDAYRVLRTLASMARPTASRGEAWMAVRSQLNVVGGELLARRYRSIMDRSGLLYDRHVDVARQEEEGHHYYSYFLNAEGSTVIGRYLSSLRGGLFDGYLNAHGYSCTPTVQAVPMLRSLAQDTEVPFADLALEGPTLTSSGSPCLTQNQLRALENICVQAKRYHEQKRVN